MDANLTPNWQALGALFAYDRGSPVMFNTGSFLLLFTLFFTVYAVVYRWPVVRRTYILLFSFYFYFMACGSYVWLLGATLLVDYAVARLIESAHSRGAAKAWLASSIVLNLAALGYFKYTNFLLELFHLATAQPVAHLDIFLPIGISFFTFQTISYKVDVYRGELKATRSLLDYAFYISFFPHLVAGPIVRAKDFLYQIHAPLMLDRAFVGQGFFLVVQGLFKKAVVADYVAQYVDLVYANPAGFSGFESLMAIYGYTLQIFCDFSGYTDMAIGLAALMGYKLCENFDSPYKAYNITDFWRRWHISLSSWLRDYVYIPLGGNRHGKFMQAVNQLLTMLIGGLWHGASLRFIVWGGAHGLALVGHKLWRSSAPGKALPDNGFTRLLGWLLTFNIVAGLWILFRAPDMATASRVFMNVFNDADFLAFVQPFWTARPLFVVVLVGGFVLSLLPKAWKEGVERTFIRVPLLVKIAALLVVVQLTLEMGSQGVQPFIYFQF